jgi:hypothetical protein
MQRSQLSYGKTETYVTFIVVGMIILVLDLSQYSIFLPSAISESSLKQIDATVYAFYLLFICGLSFVGYGSHSLIFYLSKRKMSSSTISERKSKNRSHFILSIISSLFVIALRIIANERYYRYFWAISVGYGIVYALISGLLIFHQESLAAEYGVSIPSITSMSYGPTGYVPTLAIYVSDHFGLFIVPINVLVIIAISVLVGFNGILTIYTINRQRQRTRLMMRKSMAKSESYSLFNSFVGAALGLFAACPTCASFYIFAALAGSLAPSIAAFTVAFYTLFLGISVPLLIGSSLAVLYGIYKIDNMTICKF